MKYPFVDFYMSLKHKPFKKQLVWLKKKIRKFNSNRIVCVERNGVRINLDLRDSISNGIYYGLYKNVIIKTMKEQIKEGDTVIDVGGYIGYFSLIASKLVGKRGKVFCFEPNKDNIKAINKNIELNDVHNLYVVPYGVSNINDIIELDTQTNYLINKSPSREFINGRVVRLDDFFKDYSLDKVSFIKIDTNGYEYTAIEGMKETIKKFKPNIAVAVSVAKQIPDELGSFYDKFLNFLYSFDDYNYFADVSACKVKYTKPEMKRLLIKRKMINLIMKNNNKSSSSKKKENQDG